MKHIVIGITGGIAAYKVCDVIVGLKELGYIVEVIMTKSATEFVCPLTFEGLTGKPVTVDMFRKIDNWEVEHISLAKKADIFLVVPATANILGKVAGGIGDDMLSTTILATRGQVFFAPAMHKEMYLNLVVQENIRKLQERGYLFIEPGHGRLASGDIGIGVLAPVEKIIECIHDFANRSK